jgi:hypothetical protein
MNMKTPLSLSAIRSAAFGLAVAVGISAQGATTTTSTTVPAGKKKAVAATASTASTSSQNAVGLLDQAYSLLAGADHDYQGHRAQAMHHIKEAARSLGSKLSGEGKGAEQQGTSDSQLKNAQSLLEQAVSGLTGMPHHHVEEAIRQLGVALTVK